MKLPEKIGNVKLDYRWYKGEDSYSDGDVENELLDIVKKGINEQALAADTRWPIVYHLTPMRQNLLSWYPFDKNASLLEIGMGCGAITGAFADKVKSVDGIELSSRRAQIAAWRNKDFDNITIHVGNLNDIQLDKKFDYVTLIGVLEYAGSFTEGNTPYLTFLNNCKQYLKEGGSLIIAIENRLGMKYFSGAAEDHIAGERFRGITNYQGIDYVRTFSKPALEKLLKEAGLCNIEWYYPHPDYKIPTEIFTDETDFEQYGFRFGIDSYDLDRHEYFDELSALKSVAMEGLIGIFANSFLVFARR